MWRTRWQVQWHVCNSLFSVKGLGWSTGEANSPSQWAITSFPLLGWFVSLFVSSYHECHGVLSCCRCCLPSRLQQHCCLSCCWRKVVEDVVEGVQWRWGRDGWRLVGDEKLMRGLGEGAGVAAESALELVSFERVHLIHWRHLTRARSCCHLPWEVKRIAGQRRTHFHHRHIRWDNHYCSQKKNRWCCCSNVAGCGDVGSHDGLMR